jgi:hypothetical protein
MNLQCFNSIEVSDVEVKGKNVQTQITCQDIAGKKHVFRLAAKYEEPMPPQYAPLLRIAAVMPLLNYGLFTKEIKLNYPVGKADLALLNDLLDIFSKDIFINKLVRRKNPYILPQYLPKEEEVTEANTKSIAKIVPRNVTEDAAIASSLDKNSCGVLSSGGKESLLTYAMLKELGAKVYPIYVNESGGHWRTALPAYRHHKETEPNTGRVWINVDRLYTFMLDHMCIIRPDHRRVWNDTYPIRLCIFPVYVFFLLPVFAAKKIGNLLIGSEFDDPRLSPFYKGIKHYYGVYDQTQDFDLRMEDWYQKRMPGMRQWSAVRPISGLIVERILTRRYPQVAALQRSCHSVHFEGKALVPCGGCSKCLGIMLFLRANGVDPAIMGYRKKDAEALALNVAKGGLRLDEDEREHAIFLASKTESAFKGKESPHVESIHLHKSTGDVELVPAQFRKGLLGIIGQYTNGFTALDKEEWVKAPKPKPKEA